MSTVTHNWLAEELLAGVDGADVVTDANGWADYVRDAAPFSPAGNPAVLVFPRSVAQVQHVMRTATKQRVPVVPQGARTGLAGAANATDGCILLSMTKMDKILEVDTANRMARCQPGVTTKALSDAVAPHGLFYPPDPVSYEKCTIGGNIATGAGGVCCVKYGVTADYVMGLSVVLADGRVAHMGRHTVKGVAGYDLTHLFVGSEGTLGVTVEATLALRPKAEHSLALLAQFTTASDAGAAVSAIIEAGHTPSALELMDRVTTAAVAELGHPDLTMSDASTLFIESDAPDRADAIIAMGRLCEAAGARNIAMSRVTEDAQRLLKARRMVTPALRAKAATLPGRPTAFIEDVAVPRTRLADLIDRIGEIAEANEVMIATLGHAGDGNLHPTVVFDQDDPAAFRRAQEAYDEVMAAALSMGGTITGEHGVGLLKRDWLARELDPVTMQLHRDVKNLFDPAGILNPGKVL